LLVAMELLPQEQEIILLKQTAIKSLVVVVEHLMQIMVEVV